MRTNNRRTSQPRRTMIGGRLTARLMIFCLFLMVGPDSRAEQRIDVGIWSSSEAGGLPAGWRLLSFPSVSAATRYEVVRDQFYGPVVEARSSEGAGGIGRRLSVDAHEYPILSWSWKIADTIAASSLEHRDGDDFPVRVMISFSSEGNAGVRAKDNILCYVWAATEPVGSVAINPIHRNIQTFVAASGSERRGAWIELSRNLVDDYRRAFSEDPDTITGVVLMTDTDNSGSQAQAWYGPIWLSRKGAAQPQGTND